MRTPRSVSCDPAGFERRDPRPRRSSSAPSAGRTGTATAEGRAGTTRAPWSRRSAGSRRAGPSTRGAASERTRCGWRRTAGASRPWTSPRAPCDSGGKPLRSLPCLCGRHRVGPGRPDPAGAASAGLRPRHIPLRTRARPAGGPVRVTRLMGRAGRHAPRGGPRRRARPRLREHRRLRAHPPGRRSGPGRADRLRPARVTRLRFAALTPRSQATCAMTHPFGRVVVRRYAQNGALGDRRLAVTCGEGSVRARRPLSSSEAPMSASTASGRRWTA